MLSLYGQYIKEREDFDIIETISGFITYKIEGKTCYLRDVYVIPSLRGKCVASQLTDLVAVQAKENNCTHIYGSVDPKAKGSTDSLRVLLGYGFKLKEVPFTGGLIIFEKEI